MSDKTKTKNGPSRIYSPADFDSRRGVTAVLTLLTTATIFVLIPVTQFMAVEPPVQKPKPADTSYSDPAPDDPTPPPPPPPIEPPELEEDPPEKPKPSIEDIIQHIIIGPVDSSGFGNFVPDLDIDDVDLDPERIISVKDLDGVPQAVTQVSPRYPRALKGQGIEGRAIVRFQVDTTGRVVEAVVESATSSEFGKAAVQAILKWRFEPGLKDGRPVQFKMRIAVPFRL